MLSGRYNSYHSAVSTSNDRMCEWWAWVDLNHRPRPYQGLLWCYMHSSVAMIILLTTSLMVTSWHDCWFQIARSVQNGDHFLQAVSLLLLLFLLETSEIRKINKT